MKKLFIVLVVVVAVGALAFTVSAACGDKVETGKKVCPTTKKACATKAAACDPNKCFKVEGGN